MRSTDTFTPPRPPPSCGRNASVIIHLVGEGGGGESREKDERRGRGAGGARERVNPSRGACRGKEGEKENARSGSLGARAWFFSWSTLLDLNLLQQMLLFRALLLVSLRLG